MKRVSSEVIIIISVIEVSGYCVYWLLEVTVKWFVVNLVCVESVPLRAETLNLFKCVCDVLQ